MRIEALLPLHIRRAAGDLHLRPGMPIDLPDEEAIKLLEKVPGKVRAVHDTGTTIEPAITPEGFPLTPVYWERGDRSIVGPGQPEFFFQDSVGQVGLIIAFGEEVVAIADSMLRSRKAFEEQAEVLETELVRF